MKPLARAAGLVGATLLLLSSAPVAAEEVAVVTLPAPGEGGSTTIPEAEPKRRLLVALDAGHGGAKFGAVRGDLIEKDIAASVVQALKIRLLASGYQVIETRPGDEDVELRDRVQKANDAEADLFISIHCNSMPYGPEGRKVRGAETFFLSADSTDEAARRLAEYENGEPLSQDEMASANPLDAILYDLQVSAAHQDSSRLAHIVQEALVEATGFPDRGVRQAPFAVLNGAKMPAVLVELGFLSHPKEGKELGDAGLQSRSATGILGAILKFAKILEQRDE
ncbi:MAG: N-acetylmuramoyl-L-alanine amidase [Deltaproteobacteria bacterium]|nr:N-acetylmuramoyl-L-alanine amidase [Deltaproteobacteria bacterium]